MKVALLLVVSLAALAYAGPATPKNSNQVGNQDQFNKQQQQYMTSGDVKQTEAVEQLKQWCFSSQMSQPELTASFKKLVSVIKSQPEDQSTEAAVMSERICQGALVAKSNKGETLGANGPDAQAHQLIKDVYMDALFACQSAQCKQQLVKIIDTQDEKIDSIRAAYYMTSIAVTEDGSINENDIKQLIDSLIKTTSQQQESASSEAVERQKLFATTALIAKALKQSGPDSKKNTQIKESAQQVAKLINERYIRPVSQQEVQQYKQQSAHEQSETVTKKIARRSAALKALANIPGWIIKETPEVEQSVTEIAQCKQELNIARQSAIECLEENESANSMLKQITFDQEEPMEVRVAAIRALMTSHFAGKDQSDEKKQQVASETVEQVLKHCENQKNQQNDTQFVLYAISYLNNLRTSQQSEMQAIRECIANNKQHYMQIQLLNKKFQQQLSEVSKASRNYKFEQEFNQIESGLVIEGDMVYASKQHRQQQQFNILPKLIRVNMSMPVMGETVNVVELTVRQNQMDEELLGAFKLAQSASFTGSETVNKVVDSFKNSVGPSGANNSGSNKKQQGDETVEGDLSIKIDGCTVVYVSVDDFKWNSHQNKQHKRSTGSVLDDIIEQLKQKPIAFNRGFNFNINERLAKVLDVDANIMAGLRFESRASGQSSDQFEIQTQIEPRFAFEAIVGPAKMSQKKLMQRVSTKTALGLRLRFKKNELVDVQVDLPMNTMELFTVESQLVEKSASVAHSYTYLPDSIYGQEDIYSLTSDRFYNNYQTSDDRDSQSRSNYKRSIFQRDSNSKKIAKFIAGKRAFAHSFETPEEVARATGLRGKLRMVASPKDMSFLVQALCEKYEPSMQGYRVQVQKVDRNRDQQQYIVSVSTPGARTDRTMQVRVNNQWTNQRKVVKVEFQLPKKTVSAVYELVQDQRQYAIKTQIFASSSSRQQWRHSFECGVQRNSPVGSSRIATTYKPYLSIDSSALSRPVQLEGVVSYQRAPKTVISYELKCSTSGDFVQGKIIYDQRQSSSTGNYKRSARSMRSPVEIIFNEQDVTMTCDMTAQIQEHTVKAHRMLDWSAAKKSLVSESYISYKNARKQEQEQIVSTLKLNKEQQLFTVERKCPQQERKEFRLVLESQVKPQQKQHQMVAECRYNGKSQSIVAYKHKIELAQMDLKQNKGEIVYTVELLANERQLNEKFTGRTLVNLSRKQKTVKSELASRNKSAKIDVEFVSLNQHQIEVAYQGEQWQHKCQIVADERQLIVDSRTEKRGQTWAKLSVKASKQTPVDCEIVVDVPVKNIKAVADLEFASGRTSSLAVQTPRFATKAEFSFDAINSNKYNRKSQHSHWTSSIYNPLSSISNLRFKSDLKDRMSQENYWIDSQLNKMDKSFLRFNSPIYRTDVEYEPRESTGKFGLFARSKRSISLNAYNNDDSLLNEPFSFNDDDSSSSAYNKLSLGNKMWMMRSAVGAAPNKLRRALFEYADSRQQHKHGLNWSPRDQRVNFNLNRQPMIESDDSYPSYRIQGDLATGNWYNTNNQIQKPSTLKMQSSQIGDFDFVASPFDGEQAYAKMSALSRNPRSAYKKHDSEYTYSKKHGHKASMKHLDSNNKHHSLTLEADRSPQKWTKMAFDSEKHGKADYEHQWRRHLTKRSLLDQNMRSRYENAANNYDDDMVYGNSVSFRGQSPSWTHSSSMAWVEPELMLSAQRRLRRDLNSGARRHFDSLDYLKHCAARLQSQTGSPADLDSLYKFDLDFEPNSYNTRLSLAHANDMLHESSFEYEPLQRTYKLHSKYSNLLTKQPNYEFLATSMRPLVDNLATANQEPVFIDEHHPMLEQPISQRLATKLFRQPLKLDYSDKYGRVARLDYDQFAGAASNYNGLRQKRAAFYYKDDSMDFDHQSTYDFYPETLIGQVKQGYNKQQQHSTSGDFSVKSQTKYGPIIVSANADDANANVQIESPIIRLKLTTEEAKRGVQLIKVQVDNKQQTVKLAKILRQNAPVLADCPIVEEFVSKFDRSKLEHETEILISFVDSIMRLKSLTQMDKRPTVIVDGEYNKQQQKAYFKIDGPHTKGQLLVDLNKQTAHLVLSTNDKRGLNHETRVQRTNDKFFTVESQSSYKQEPLYKLSAKLSAEILREPEHLFASRRLSAYSGLSSAEKHISSFDAVIYHPKQYQLTGQYDCQKKEAQVVVRDVEKRETSEVRVIYDDQAENVYVQARSASPRGIVKQMNKTINVTPLIKAY